MGNSYWQHLWPIPFQTLNELWPCFAFLIVFFLWGGRGVRWGGRGGCREKSWYALGSMWNFSSRKILFKDDLDKERNEERAISDDKRKGAGHGKLRLKQASETSYKSAPPPAYSSVLAYPCVHDTLNSADQLSVSTFHVHEVTHFFSLYHCNSCYMSISSCN